MRRLPLLLLTLPLLFASPARAQQAPALTIEQVMADPDWIGPPVEQAWWAWDSQQVHYNLKREGSPVRDTYTQAISGAAASRVGDGERSALDAPTTVFDAGRQRMAFVRNGDLFVRDLRNGALTQLTRSNDQESQPRFSTDGGLTWRVGNQWYRSTADGRVSQAAQVLAEKDPATKPKPDALRDQQLRTLDTLARDKAQRDAWREQSQTWRQADSSRAPAPVYLGDDVQIDPGSRPRPRPVSRDA